MKRGSKYCIKKSSLGNSNNKKTIKKIKLPNDLEVNVKKSGRVINHQREKKQPSKLIINKISRNVFVTDEVSKDSCSISEESSVSTKGESPQESNKKSKPSNIVIKLAIQLLKEIDPQQQMDITEVEEVLKEQIHQTENLIEIGAIEYLLDSFDTLENQNRKLQLKDKNRKVQEKMLKGKRMEKKIFVSRINLDLPKEDRKPDENDRIYRTGKQVYSGSLKGYKNPLLQNKKKINQFKNFAAPKKNMKKLKEFNI